MDCQSGYSYHQQDKQILGGCLHNREGQAAVQYIESVNYFVGLVEGGADKKMKCVVL